MARREIKGSRAIVTGASSGIGREVARQLARQGARLVITARRVDRLRELADEIITNGGEAAFVAGDICDPSVRENVVRTCHEQFGGLDVLVNNAGLGAIGPFADASPRRLEQIMDVNFTAPVELIRVAIPLLRDGQRPIIVNISSVLGHRAVPGKSEYCAAKFALHGFSDAIRAEFEAWGIDVLLVSPSTTKSEFFEKTIEPGGEVRVNEIGAMSPEAVAEKTIRAIRRGKHEIILSIPGKFLVWIDRLAPGLANRLVQRFG